MENILTPDAGTSSSWSDSCFSFPDDVHLVYWEYMFVSRILPCKCIIKSYIKMISVTVLEDHLAIIEFDGNTASMEIKG
jgi:hypothetical protein